MKYYQGIYKPVYPEKWITNGNPVIYRSGLEKKIFSFLEASPSVIEIASEEVKIPYVKPQTNRWHTYFVDLYIKVKDKNGDIKKYLIEIKPDAFIRPPANPKRKTKSYLKKVDDWIVNQAKWKFAEKFCEKHDMGFKIITDKMI
ncbi:TnsA endonuclease N-terminal domain-containing protein [uncultured Arcobacter sp.]|uniref:TnsA endonuclease N-terminal domain-containing protein n=1 Tax=uncultured Arcobacter sp. TaxID=165434 RepID=UPI002609B40F|nr:TnsA endonuclease N-terminal domain-containing protein [uncultured Arcobacter sp.]